MDRWVGRVAMVTGASSGIGSAVAKDLVKAGLKVIALGRRKDRLDALVTELANEKGELHPFQCDITNEEDIKAAFKYANTKFNGIDILINNAGISKNCSVLDGPKECFKPILDTNLLGLTICIHEAYQSMKAKGVDDGHIVNINSVAGHSVLRIPNSSVSVYSASKYGVTAMTEGLRHELLDKNSKIRMTSISPGYVETEIIYASGASKEMIAMCENMPALKPEDISNSVLFVLAAPPHVQINELTIRPVGSPF